MNNEIPTRGEPGIYRTDGIKLFDTPPQSDISRLKRLQKVTYVPFPNPSKVLASLPQSEDAWRKLIETDPEIKKISRASKMSSYMYQTYIIPTLEELLKRDFSDRSLVALRGTCSSISGRIVSQKKDVYGDPIHDWILNQLYL